MFRLAGEAATVKIPLSPFCKGETQTRLKSHELTNRDNEAYRCKAFPPLKKGGQGGFRTYVKRNILLKFAIFSSSETRLTNLTPFKGSKQIAVEGFQIFDFIELTHR